MAFTLPSWWPKWLGGSGTPDPDPRLTDAAAAEAWIEFQQECSRERALIPCTKQELAAALVAADEWLEANLADYDAAPDPEPVALDPGKDLRGRVPQSDRWPERFRAYYALKLDPPDPERLTDETLLRMVAKVRHKRREVVNGG